MELKQNLMILLKGLIMTSGLACAVPPAKAQDLPLPKTDLPAAAEGETTRTAVFAGGCFWCVEAVFEQMEGVTEVVSGYAGGTKETADYKKVSGGTTDHAEVVKITYDPRKISYGQLLRIFFATHDPTTLNRQGGDVGRQYRSAVFYQSQQEKEVVEGYIGQLNEAKVFANPIVTTLEPLADGAGGGFYLAEQYHQDYAKLNPGNPYIQNVSAPKAEKARKLFKEQLKKSAQ